MAINVPFSRQCSNVLSFGITRLRLSWERIMGTYQEPSKYMEVYAMTSIACSFFFFSFFSFSLVSMRKGVNQTKKWNWNFLSFFFVLEIYLGFKANISKSGPAWVSMISRIVHGRGITIFLYLWHLVAFVHSIHITLFVHWYNQLSILHT